MEFHRSTSTSRQSRLSSHLNATDVSRGAITSDGRLLTRSGLYRAASFHLTTPFFILLTSTYHSLSTPYTHQPTASHSPPRFSIVRLFVSPLPPTTIPYTHLQIYINIFVLSCVGVYTFVYLDYMYINSNFTWTEFNSV